MAGAIPAGRVDSGRFEHNARGGQAGAGVIRSSGPEYPLDGYAQGQGLNFPGGHGQTPELKPS